MSKFSRASILVPIALIVVQAGCANQNSIFRKNVARGSSPVVITSDAKQRHLVIAPGQSGKPWRICAEAAPDVFSALSTSAAADLGFGQGGAETEARAKAALAIAESAGTIERTQTINMLRESMYRTCERYLSGAIDESAFAVQAGRDWRAMIAILAIEQLTRAARPPATIIAAGSTSAAVEGPSEAVLQLAAAQGAEEKALSDKQAADDALAAAKCGTITNENKEICEGRKREADKAAAALTLATQHRVSWDSIARSTSEFAKSNASTTSGLPAIPGVGAPGAAASSASSSDVGKAAEVIGNIVHWAFDTDETQLFCIQALKDPVLGVLTQQCISYLLEKVQAERNLFKQAGVAERVPEIVNAIALARTRMAQFISSLDDKSYAIERGIFSTRLGSFCENFNRNRCLAAVAFEGETDSVAEKILPIIDERMRARNQP